LIDEEESQININKSKPKSIPLTHTHVIYGAPHSKMKEMCVAEGPPMYDMAQKLSNMAFFVRKRERSMMMMRRIVVLLLLLISSSVVVDGLDSKKKSQEVIKDDGPDLKFHTHYFTAKEKTNQNGVVRIGALSPIY
jgi:hypothetical protein